MYSDRPSAPATAFSGKIDERVKKARLQTLLDLQAGITAEKYQAMLGQVRTVLVEGTSRSLDHFTNPAGDGGLQWTGRTSSNHIVHFPADEGNSGDKELLTGAFADIMIETAHAHSLGGRLIQGPMGATPEKGEKTIAA